MLQESDAQHDSCVQNRKALICFSAAVEFVLRYLHHCLVDKRPVPYFSLHLQPLVQDLSPWKYSLKGHHFEWHYPILHKDEELKGVEVNLTSLALLWVCKKLELS